MEQNSVDATTFIFFNPQDAFLGMDVSISGLSHTLTSTIRIKDFPIKIGTISKRSSNGRFVKPFFTDLLA